MPAPEDHRRQADEPPPKGHVLIKPADRPQSEPRTAETRHHAGRNNMRIAGLYHVNAQRVGGAWMLANRAGTKPVPGVEKIVGRQCH